LPLDPRFLMLARNVPIRVTSEQLGHANPGLTARVYAHAILEAQRDAVGVLPKNGFPIGSRSGQPKPPFLDREDP
jgi:hypothetical protein